MDAEIFWKNVMHILKEKKISQEVLCDGTGISIWTLRGSISKKIFPRVDMAKTISDYLGTSVDFLLTGKDSNEYKVRLDNLKMSLMDLIEQEGK